MPVINCIFINVIDIGNVIDTDNEFMTKVVDLGRQQIYGVIDIVDKCITVTHSVVNKKGYQNLSPVLLTAEMSSGHIDSLPFLLQTSQGENHARCKQPNSIGSFQNIQKKSSFNNFILSTGINDDMKKILTLSLSASLSMLCVEKVKIVNG